MKLTPEQAMELAIQEAYGGWGRVAPNPLVGCVVLDSENNLLSKGFHAQYGGPHAEVHALTGVPPEKLKGTHVYVTLEPCAHQGKTPPCAQFLAQLPIASVTYGTVDPNPKVSGQGHEILKKAGKVVSLLKPYEGVCKELAEVFLYHIQQKKTFVAMKVAVTQDGYLSTTVNQQTQISNSLSLQYAHYLRAGYDAVLVGRQTVEIDNPQLNNRLQGYSDIKNKVVILDPKGKLLKTIRDKNIFKSHDPNDVIMVVEKGRGGSAGVTVLEVDVTNDGIDLKQMLADLYDLGITSLFVEGGAKTIQKFLDQNLIQRVYIFESPKQTKADDKLPHLNHHQIRAQLKNIKEMQLDTDKFITGRF